MIQKLADAFDVLAETINKVIDRIKLLIHSLDDTAEFEKESAKLVIDIRSKNKNDKKIRKFYHLYRYGKTKRIRQKNLTRLLKYIEVNVNVGEKIQL